MKKQIWILLLFFTSLSLSQETLVGHWTFDDANNLLHADIGSDLILVGSHNAISDADTKEGGIAIAVGSYYILPHGMAASGGGSNVNEYTFVMDVQFPQLGHWFTLYQTDPTNTSDGEVFINPTGNMGVAATGYTGTPVEPQKWYRIAIVVKNGHVHNYYIDGILALAATPGPVDGRFSLGSTVLLFADDNSEDNLIHVNDIQLYSKALTKTEVEELGGFGNFNIFDPTTEVIPYLQTPTPTSIYVCWQTSTEENTLVKYGPTEAMGSIASGASQELGADIVWHWVKLKGLTPNTEYYYQIDSPSVEPKIFKFQTIPEYGENEGHIRFGLRSDNQTDFRTGIKVANAMTEKMKELYGDNLASEIDLIFTTGDIVGTGSNLPSYKTEYFQPLYPLSPYMPSMVSIGNHEAESPNYYNYMKYEDLAGPEGEAYYKFQIGRILFIALNSNWQWRNNRQIEWLAETLENAQHDDSIDWIFTFCHHPGLSSLWIPGNTPYIQQRVIPLLAQYDKTELLAYGHTHGYENGVHPEETLRTLCVGGAAGWLDRWRATSYFDYPEVYKTYDHYHFVIVDVDITNRSYTIQTWSLGHTDKWLNSVKIDSVVRRLDAVDGPNQPVALIPAEPVDLPYMLQASKYTGEDSILASQFQLAAIQGDYSDPLVDSYRDFEHYFYDTGAPYWEPINQHAGIDLTSLSFDKEDVKPGTSFWWRVRYRDRNLQWSEWSEEAVFKVRDRRLSQEPNDMPESATQLFTNDSLFAEFGTFDDVDWYQFYFNETTIYYLASFESEPGVEPDIELYYENDLTTNLLSMSAKGLNDAGDFRTGAFFPPKSGYYFARAFNTGSRTGQYKIRLSGGRTTGDMMVFEYDNTIGNMLLKSALPEGDTLAAAIFPVDDVDFFKIEGQAGDRFEIGTAPVFGLGIRDTDTYIALINDQSEILFENDNRGIDSTVAGEERTNTFSVMNGVFPGTETFYLRVQCRYRSATDTINIGHPGIGEYGVYYLTTPGTGVETLEPQVPQKYRLYQNYPNPFNPVTEIKFDLPENELVTIKVFDVLGKQVATLLNERRPVGSHSAFWNGMNSYGHQMASGLYIISISTLNFNDAVKITLLR